MVMTEILTNLYLGSYSDAADFYQILKYNIRNIVSVMTKTKKIFPDRHYLSIQVSDDIKSNLLKYFPLSNKFIHDARLRGENVLVHCAVGRSRSVTIIAAYLMAATNLNDVEALHYIKARRPIANPNPSFKIQLSQYLWGFLRTEKVQIDKKLIKDDARKIARIMSMVYKKANLQKPNKFKINFLDREMYYEERRGTTTEEEYKQLGFLKYLKNIYMYYPPKRRIPSGHFTEVPTETRTPLLENNAESSSSQESSLSLVQEHTLSSSSSTS